MSKVERWIALEGEPPADVAELLEAARAVPDLTPEEAGEMERSFLAALAVRRRARVRKRNARLFVALGFLAAAVAAALALGLHPAAPIPPIARDALSAPSAIEPPSPVPPEPDPDPDPSQLGIMGAPPPSPSLAPSPAPPSSVPDAGPVRHFWHFGSDPR